MNKKTTVVNNKDEIALAEWKRLDEELRQKRAELMYRLYSRGMNQQRIANIYGCKRQFVQQELKKYQAVSA